MKLALPRKSQASSCLEVFDRNVINPFDSFGTAAAYRLKLLLQVIGSFFGIDKISIEPRKVAIDLFGIDYVLDLIYGTRMAFNCELCFFGAVPLLDAINAIIE